MKKWILPLVIFTTALQAQDMVFEVRNETRNFSGGLATAFVVDIPDATLAEAKSAFQGKMKEFSKSKVENADNEIGYKQIVVSTLSKNPLDVYATFYEKAGAVTFVGFFYIDSAFVGNESAERTYSTVHKFVVDYANSVYKLGLEHKLSGETRSLSNLKKELKSNFKEQENIQKEIIKANREIEKSGLKIKELNTEVELITNEIGKRKEVSISSYSDPEEKKKAKSEISEMEHKRSKLNKELDRQHKNINHAQSTIRQLEIDLKDKQREAEVLALKIAEQEKHVEGVKSKMGGVKK